MNEPTETITLEELADLWPEQGWMCTACGATGSIGFDPSEPPPDVNFFPCECGATDKKVKTDRAGRA